MTVETKQRCSMCGEWRRTLLFVGEGDDQVCVHCKYDPPTPEPAEEREVCPTCHRKKPGRSKKS